MILRAYVRTREDATEVKRSISRVIRISLGVVIRQLPAYASASPELGLRRSSMIYTCMEVLWEIIRVGGVTGHVSVFPPTLIQAVTISYICILMF